MQQSGMSVTKYLQHVGINYNTYNYWRKKLKENDSPKPELAPISFTQHADPVFSSAVPSGVQKTADIHPPKTGISVHFSDVFILMALQ